MTAQLKTISMQLGTMHMNATLMDALRKATKTMKKVGEDLDMKELTKTLKEYQKESMKMGLLTLGLLFASPLAAFTSRDIGSPWRWRAR